MEKFILSCLNKAIQSALILAAAGLLGKATLNLKKTTERQLRAGGLISLRHVQKQLQQR